jgi:hypothetical protein
MITVFWAKMIPLLSRDFIRVNGFREHERFLIIDCLRENNAGSEYAFQIPFLVGANGSVFSFILELSQIHPGAVCCNL